LPFDQFIIEQFAGDLLPDATLGQRTATGFHRNTLQNDEGDVDPEEFRVEAVADRVNTMGVALLGLTVGCARCHDHKFDPISQREYFELFAFLNNCEEPTLPAPTQREIDDGKLAAFLDHQSRVEALERRFRESDWEEFSARQRELETTLTIKDTSQFHFSLRRALEVQLDARSPEQSEEVSRQSRKHQLALDAFPILGEISELKENAPSVTTSLVLQERTRLRPTHIHPRGVFLDPGERVDPAVPAILHPLRGTGRSRGRLDLAGWLTDRSNPLTARVTVNRYWQRLFRRRLVATENDFGTQGDPPTHPELLDWLAAEFMIGEWDCKSILRRVVSSAVYRQQSRLRSSDREIDPRNVWLSRQQRLPVEAETVRDLALAASGLLSRGIGGPSVFPPQPDDVFALTQSPKAWDLSQGADRYRRAMYTHFYRTSPYPTLMVFDFPESNVSCTRRTRSNTPLQSLALANDQLFVQCAQALGRRILDAPAAGDEERVNRLFLCCLSRRPESAECERRLWFVESRRKTFSENPTTAAEFVRLVSHDAPVVRWAAWTAAARAVMNLDEFITRE